MSDWIKYDGKGQPVADDVLLHVVLKTGTGNSKPLRADYWDWNHYGTAGDIEAYRLAEPALQTSTPLKEQVGGDHYRKLKIQPMEYSMANDLNACQHTIIKYVTRYKDKAGKQDLLKAKHTIDLLLAMEYPHDGNE